MITSPWTRLYLFTWVRFNSYSSRCSVVVYVWCQRGSFHLFGVWLQAV